MQKDYQQKNNQLSYTDKLTDDEIRLRLEDYSKVDDIATVPLGTHLRYFITDKDGNYKFRMGGQLYRNEGIPVYVQLTNGKDRWSVQLEGTVFYKKISFIDMKNTLTNDIKQRDEKIDELTKEKKYLLNSINKYKSEINSLKEKLNKYKK